MTTTDFIANLLLGTSAALWAAGWVVFYPGKDVAFKRGLLPRYFIGGVVLLGFTATVAVLAAGSIWAAVAFLVCLPVVISMLSCMWFCGIKLVKFCDRCGAPAVPRWSEPERFCMRCGADLDAKPSSDHELD